MFSRPVNYLVYFFLISACHVSSAEARAYQSRTLQPYLIDFIKEGRARGYEFNPFDPYTLTISYIEVYEKKEHQKAIALCEWTKFSSKITVRIDYWAKADLREREAVMFHELGHCLLKRSHCDVVKGNRFISVMHEIPENAYPDGWRKEYLDELFKRDVDCPENY